MQVQKNDWHYILITLLGFGSSVYFSIERAISSRNFKKRKFIWNNRDGYCFLTTLALPLKPLLIIIGVIIGGSIGTYIAQKIEMTALITGCGISQLVGLAACFVAASAFYVSCAYGIGELGDIAEVPCLRWV